MIGGEWLTGIKGKSAQRDSRDLQSGLTLSPISAGLSAPLPYKHRATPAVAAGGPEISQQGGTVEMTNQSSQGAGGHGWGPSWTTLTAGTSSFAGTAGVDALYTGSSGSTVQIAAVELLLGGVGTDVVSLGSAGATLAVAGMETLTGGTGTDLVALGGYGSTLAVSGIETLWGSAGADVVTVTGGTVTFEGLTAGDRLTLAAGNGADRIVLDQATGAGPHGFGLSTPGDYAQVTNFQSGTDSLVIAGQLRRQVDHDRDGTVDTASRATGTVDLSADEVVALTATATSLTDTDLASVRAAIGTVTNGSARNATIVLVGDGAGNSGAYAVSDRNGDGQIGASEIRLLGVFSGSNLTATDLLYG